MIEKVNLYQKVLHHRKIVRLDGIDPEVEIFYITKELLNDLNDKLSEIIDHVNALEKNNQSTDGAIKRALDPTTRLEAEREVLEAFVNEGDTCLMISAQNVLEAAVERKDDVTGFDVVFIKQMDAETPNVVAIANTAILIAGKRIIVGIDQSLKDSWDKYMAQVKYHWVQYEVQNEAMEYYIIDKLEGETKTPTETIA